MTPAPVQVMAAAVQIRPFLDYKALARDAELCTALLAHLHVLFVELKRRRSQPRSLQHVGEVRAGESIAHPQASK